MWVLIPSELSSINPHSPSSKRIQLRAVFTRFWSFSSICQGWHPIGLSIFRKARTKSWTSNSKWGEDWSLTLGGHTRHTWIQNSVRQNFEKWIVYQDIPYISWKSRFLEIGLIECPNIVPRRVPPLSKCYAPSRMWRKSLHNVVMSMQNLSGNRDGAHFIPYN